VVHLDGRCRTLVGSLGRLGAGLNDLVGCPCARTHSSGGQDGSGDEAQGIGPVDRGFSRARRRSGTVVRIVRRVDRAAGYARDH